MLDSWPLVAWVLLAAAVTVAVLTWRLHHLGGLARAHGAAAAREDERRAAARERSIRAVAGERDAVALLEGDGYAVIDWQVRGSWTLRADGEPVTVGLRADYLVLRNGRRYIAEVKTGRLAPSLSHGPTRRQLLEYRAAFDVDGVVLVDAGVRTITHVDLAPFVAKRPDGGRLGALPLAIAGAILFSIGVALGTALSR